jgi:hypothetical protein
MKGEGKKEGEIKIMLGSHYTKTDGETDDSPGETDARERW